MNERKKSDESKQAITSYEKKPQKFLEILFRIFFCITPVLLLAAEDGRDLSGVQDVVQVLQHLLVHDLRVRKQEHHLACHAQAGGVPHCRPDAV